MDIATEVEAGVWTYLEVATAITCGNLPLLAPLLRRWLSRNGSRNMGYNTASMNPHMQRPTNITATNKATVYSGFARIEDSPSGSQVELQDREAGRIPASAPANQLGQIVVQTKVEVKREDSSWEEVQPADLVSGNHRTGSVRPS